MLTLTFIGYDKEGKKISGVKKVKSPEVMEQFITSNEITHFRVFESKTKFSLRNYSLVSAKELSIFCKQMSSLLSSNISLTEGIALIIEEAENKNLKTALNEVMLHMKNGLDFSTAMSMYKHIFGLYLTNIISIGENVIPMHLSFERMAQHFEKEHLIHKKLKSAITYPMGLSVLIAGIILLLVVRVFPMFRDILISMGGEIPYAARVIFDVSSFIASSLVVVILVIVGMTAYFAYYTSKEKGALWFDKMKVTMPIIRYIYTRVIAAKVSINLSVLLKAGVSLINSLEYTTTLIDNKYLENKLENAIYKIKHGEELETALKEVNIFPPLFLKMIVIGEKTSKLDEMLEKSSNYLDDEIYDAVEKIISMIEPTLIIILSVVVGIILISVILPMVNIMNGIGI